MNHETKSLANGLGNLAFSIVIPIFILNSTKLPFSPEVRLIIAILFPLFYGAFEWWQTKKANFLSIFGLVNVLVTGGFGLLHLEGMWFSIKEASFPLLIGIFIFISGFRQAPVFGKMLTSPEFFNTEKLEEKLLTLNKKEDFQQLIRRSNHFLAFSFFMSAALNFIIAIKTFTPINPTLDAAAKANVLNEQIALMHQRGFLGIALPSMVMMLGLLGYYFKQVEKITGESIEAYFQTPLKK